jgi:hypothetical protein
MEGVTATPLVHNLLVYCVLYHMAHGPPEADPHSFKFLSFSSTSPLVHVGPWYGLASTVGKLYEHTSSQYSQAMAPHCPEWDGEYTRKHHETIVDRVWVCVVEKTCKGNQSVYDVFSRGMGMNREAIHH